MMSKEFTVEDRGPEFFREGDNSVLSGRVAPSDEHHTPGPWRVEFDESVSIRSADDSRLCTINWLRGRNGLRGRIENREGEANARLIAASPDLLAALKEAKRALWKHARQESAAAIQQINAAIAKAEGRS